MEPTVGAEQEALRDKKTAQTKAQSQVGTWHMQTTGTFLAWMGKAGAEVRLETDYHLGKEEAPEVISSGSRRKVPGGAEGVCK